MKHLYIIWVVFMLTLTHCTARPPTPEQMAALYEEARVAIPQMDLSTCGIELDGSTPSIRFAKRGTRINMVGDPSDPETVRTWLQFAAEIHEKVLLVIENDWIAGLERDPAGRYSNLFYAVLSEEGLALFTEQYSYARGFLVLIFKEGSLTAYALDLRGNDGSNNYYRFGEARGIIFAGETVAEWNGD